VRGNLRYAGNPDEYFAVIRASGAGVAAYARAIEYYGLAMVMEYGATFTSLAPARK